MIYLASPYSGNEQENYEKALFFTARALNLGFVIYSPIVHCHNIAVEYGLPGDFEFWQKFDTEMIRKADKLWVLMIPGWRESKGVRAEIEIAQKLKKRMEYIEDV